MTHPEGVETDRGAHCYDAESELRTIREADLRSVYDVLHCIYDTCQDEGDRIYLGSTNDHWTIRRQLRRLEKMLDPTPAQPSEPRGSL